MMEKDTLVSNLKWLIHADFDAVHSYGQALDSIEDQEIREQLSRFRDEHQQHASELSDKLRQMGEEPPRFSRDFAGFLLEGMTVIRNLTGGLEGTLKALRDNENVCHGRYGAAMGWDVPDDISQLISRIYGDQKAHKQYFTALLQKRPWEKRAA